MSVESSLFQVNDRMMMPTLSRNTVVVASQSQVSCPLGAEMAILSLRSDVYFGLNPIGAWVWSQIQEPRSIDDVCSALLARYDVEPAAGERDLLALLHELAVEGLIEVSELSRD